MTTRLVEIAVDAADPGRLAQFWAAALGWEVLDEDPDETEVAAVAPAGFRYPDPAALPLAFVPVPEPKAAKNRVHLDLATQSAEQMTAEVARLRDLGARPADIGQHDVPWVVLADPEGNEFCVLDPRPMHRDIGAVAAVAVDCADPVSLARFWERAAGCVRIRSEAGWEQLRSPDGTGPFLEFLQVPDRKTVKNRMHLDVAPAQGDDQALEVRRLQEAGAAAVDIGQGDVSWTVLTDPEGGEFCVLTPR